MSFEQPSNEQVETLLRGALGKKIAVVGDAMLDGYIIGRIDRISPEAPVPVLEVEKEDWKLGGAANVAQCLVALGCDVRMCCITGDDPDGRLFADELKNLTIDPVGVIADASRPTTRKTRVIAKQQQVVRLDHEVTHEPAAGIEKKLITQVKAAAKWADAVILSDYDKGVLTERVCQAVIEAAKGVGEIGVPVLVDPKVRPWAKYKGATVLKPNRKETEQYVGFAITNDVTAEEAAKQLAKKLKAQSVLVTRGSAGMSLLAGKGKAQGLTTFKAEQHEVFDVTGAGDVVISVLAALLAAGADTGTATWLANVAAGIKVQKFGAATVTGQEILDAIDSQTTAVARELDYERKVMTLKEAAAFAKKMQKQGKKVVFTNGCFDILHLGHVTYLEKSRRTGDAMIVGINTDDSVKRLKGPGRPVQKEHDRARIIASQACVDGVVLFDEDTPYDLIKSVNPDILTKGADYKRKEDIVGWDIVEKNGGSIQRIELVEGKSTTNLIEKSKE
ncbi:Bifunctional protein HldE [Poriferisphaera corsica]|uniref:Bifunctional protein HldE n=1 Tax=Poriferisphaera corsica TaxID=2528020 RepID=A0A517YXN2_9BACT|nr:D-glycero-beta-D-manno-heptose-7-phosphate kinase [Poriferisphaera corsica]QDU34983.1 Bifunctional protein HldE [Poriferisphaera corsica]